MRKKISILLIIVCVLPLINLKLVIAETTSKLVGIELKYPENQDFYSSNSRHRWCSNEFGIEGNEKRGNDTDWIL